MTRGHISRCITSLLLWLSLPAGAIGSDAVVEITDTEAKYRQIEIQVSGTAPPGAMAYQVWFSDTSFLSTDQAELHSTVLIGDTSGLERPAPGVALDDCSSNGQPLHRDQRGRPVINPGTSRWSCSLTGMHPGKDQWIAVVPVETNGQMLVMDGDLTPVRGRTDAPDERTPVSYTHLTLPTTSP